MISPQQLKGTGVALVTPFNQDKEIDHSALARLVDFVLDDGVDFLVALGTTAETATLSEKEKQEVIQTIKTCNQNRVPLVVGLGGNNTGHLIDTINKTNFDGIDAILSVTPYYNKPTQEGLYQHYKAIAEVSPVPLIVYNVPSRTGCNITSSTTLRLANDFDNIIAVKEASGNLQQIMEIIKDKPNDFMILSGDDGTTLPIIASGGDGVISVIANGFPKEFSQMVRLCIDNRLDEARQIHYRLFDLMKSIFIDGNPAGIKAVLELRQIIDNQLRLPLVKVSDKTYALIKEQFEAF
ncbi:MAG: 4-hydroxy-tetrahydrodipicolinate synthase [Carboxylicivirga sp.]|jgi:4-hydroxy-tetrahydrodipicolinate synthase|nr:4-hydroxy-tetrahydrodipicolinate synthase [Carboxylicivirga sp.]